MAAADYTFANKLPTAITFANTMLYMVKNNLVTGSLIQAVPSEDLTRENKLITNFKRPVRLSVKEGLKIDVEDILMGSETFKIDTHRHVAVGDDDLGIVTSWDDMMKNSTLKAAAYALAQYIDMACARELLKFPNWIGTPGATLGKVDNIIKATNRMFKLAVPMDNISAILDGDDITELKIKYIDSNIQAINAKLLSQSGFVTMVDNVKLHHTQNLPTLTTGTRSAAQVDGASQNSNYRDIMANSYISQQLKVKGMGNAKTISKGEVFTIAGVYALQMNTKENLGYLQQFVVLEDATSTSGGVATLKISPGIIIPKTDDSTGNSKSNTTFGNCSAAPADGAALTFIGDPSKPYLIRGMFQKYAIRLASVPLMMPYSGTAAVARDPMTGISIRYWRFSAGTEGKHFHRWDIFFGVKAMENTFGVRLNG